MRFTFHVLRFTLAMLIGIDASRAALAHHTGTETYAYQLIREMAPLASAESRLRLYTHQPPQPAEWPNSPFVETRLIPFPRLWTHLRLGVEVAQNRPDVLFVPAHVLPFYCPIPAVVTVHDLGYLYYPQAHTPFQRWYVDYTTRRHLKTARRIIADSQATKDDLISHYRARAEMIDVVHLGVDSRLKPGGDIEMVKANYRISGDYLLYIGTLQPRKNLIRLLQAFAQIANDFPLKLVLAGQKGWLYDEIFATVQSLSLNERVIFTGFVAEVDKAPLLSGAAAFVFPSLYEGFGLPALEAMACGTPCLTSANSSLPEIVGDAAILVDPLSVDSIANGLRQLLSDSALRHSLRERGLAQAKKFSWGKSAEQIFSILQDVATMESK